MERIYHMPVRVKIDSDNPDRVMRGLQRRSMTRLRIILEAWSSTRPSGSAMCSTASSSRPMRRRSRSSDANRRTK